MAGGAHPLIDQIISTPEGDSVEYDNFLESMAQRLLEAGLHPDDYDMRVLWLFRDFDSGETNSDDFGALADEILVELAVCGDETYARHLADLAFQAYYTLGVYAAEIDQGLAPTDDDEPLIDQASIFHHIHEIAKLKFELTSPV